MRGDGECDALADGRGKHGWVVIGERLGCLAGEQGARAATVQHEARRQFGPVDAGLCHQRQHFSGRPAVERRRLHRDQHQVAREQSRTHQAGDARRPVNHDMIGVAGQFWRLAMQGVTRKADNAEQARQAFPATLLGPVERRALGIGVDQRHALSLRGPCACEVERQRRLADAALLVEERQYHRAPPE